MPCTSTVYLLVMIVVHTALALAPGHSQNGGKIIPTLSFQRQLAIQCMENNILTDPGDIGRPMWIHIRPQIVQCKL